MDIEIKMNKEEKYEFIKLLYKKCGWDDVISYAYDLLEIAKVSEEYQDVFDELSEDFADYKVKDALEKDFMKIVTKIKEEENRDYSSRINDLDNAGDDVYENWRDHDIKEIFEELYLNTRARLLTQDKNDENVKNK